MKQKNTFYSIEYDSSTVPNCVTANPIFPAETVAPLACEGLLNKESAGKSRKVEEGEAFHIFWVGKSVSNLSFWQLQTI